MSKIPLPANEAERLQALASYELLDTPPETDFDEIARIASETCRMPIALVTLVGERHQWFKAHHGTELEQVPREAALCSYAIMEPERPLVVPDTRLDACLGGASPLPPDLAKVVSYAAVPLVNPEGYPLGTLCVMGHRPNHPTEGQLRTLKALANTVAQLFELRRKEKYLDVAKKKLEDTNREVAEMAYVLSHDLKSPLNSIVSLLEVLRNENGSQMDESGQELLDMLHESASNLSSITKGTIQYFNTTRSLAQTQERVNMHELMMQLLSLIHPPSWAHIHYPADMPDITTSRVALQHILVNLLSNAIKYCDKETCHVHLGFSETPDRYQFSVTDNGPGIELGHQAKVFRMFQTLGRTDRHGHQGTGIGLAIARRMVEKMGGSIGISLPQEGGTRFTFTLSKLAVPEL
jgi:signal transduction histidine kinase